MDFGISTRCLQSRTVTVDLLERLRRAEFTRIELHAKRPFFDFYDRSFLRSVAAWFHENALGAPSLHLPFEEDLGRGQTRPIDLLHPERRVREEAMDQMKRCLELAEHLPLDFAVLHLGTAGDEFNPLKFDFAYAALSGIQAFSGVRVLLENIPNGIASLERLLEFKSVAQLPDIGICYDIGHGRIETAETESAIPDDVQAMHVDDNDGENDEHLLPFDGSRDWPAFVATISESKFAGPFIFEPAGPKLKKANECRSRLLDLFHEAESSIEDFRLKYKLPSPHIEEPE